MTWTSRGSLSEPPHTVMTNHTNHIFNTINSALRVWGSSIHYNRGVTAFIVTVPSDTKLYHGTSKTEAVTGLQWFATEPEHAMLFAKPDASISESKQSPLVPRNASSDGSVLLSNTKSFHSTGATIQYGSGFLQTYTIQEPLRLLYLDGMSAAKSVKGTLDLQDRVILGQPAERSISGPSDTKRAKDLCRIVTEDWSNRVDGFVRMETGFEIILCSTNKVELQESVQTGPVKDLFATYQAMSDRFDDIGLAAVRVNYEAFTTMFTFSGIEPSDVQGQFVGFRHASNGDFSSMRSSIDRMVLHMDSDEPSTDWQTITDRIIGRYASRLIHLASGIFENKNLLDEELLRTLGPFVEFENASEMAIQRCTNRFIPSIRVKSLAHFAVKSVSQRICRTLFLAYTEDTSVELATKRIDSLVRWLDWTIWKRCHDCKPSEICYTPVWPISRTSFGEREPACLNETGFINMYVRTNS